MIFKPENSPETLLKIIIRVFFSDLHIIVIDMILRDSYTTEYSISKELKIGIDRIKIVTNNLINEKLINYEERLFKNLKKTEGKVKDKRGYRLKYLYFDRIFFIHCIKKKFKRVIANAMKENIEESGSFLECPRKICGKVYKMKDIKHLTLDEEEGLFVCSNILSFDIACGSKLLKKEKNLSLEITNFRTIKKLIDSVQF